MPIIEKEHQTGPFRFLHLTGEPGAEYSILILCDTDLNDQELKLLENFHKLGREILLLVPGKENPVNSNLDFSPVLTALNMLPGKLMIISMGGYAPFLIENFKNLAKVVKIVFVNPAYNESISTKMAAFEVQVLVLSSTPGNLDHNPDAVKYHDLISGSSIAYVRGINGNPIYERFTQSFNSIRRFMSND